MNDQANRALSDALTLAGLGYQLTPVTIRRRPDGKKGATFHAAKGWRHESAWTTDIDQIRAWWVDYPDTSFALRTGHAGGVDVVDLDVSGEHDAVAWWSQQGHPLTAMLVATPSGGLHLYAAADGLPTSASVFAPGVDTRGDGGLVFAPGGYVVGEPTHYEVQGPWVAVADLEPFAPGLAHAIRDARPAGKSYTADGAIVLKDRAVIIEKCRAQVQALAALPPRTGGSTFRDAQMGAAMMLGRLVESGACTRTWALEQLEAATVRVWGSVSGADAANITSGLADGPRKERWRFWPETPPPAAGQHSTSLFGTSVATAHAVVTPPTELRVVGDDDAPYDPVAAALAAEQAEVDAILRQRRLRRLADEAERPHRDPIAAGLVWDDNLTAIAPPDMAVGELVPEAAVGFVGGPSGSYKSFVLVQLAAGLAYGRPVMGHPEFDVPRPRRVLYVAGEGASGVALRARAALHHHRIDGGRELAVYPRAVDLTSEREFDELRAVMLAEGIRHLVVDTFRQSTIGLNENDNSEVGIVIGRLLQLRDHDGISSTMADHTNKTVQGLADLGGAGAKRANVDYVLMIDLPNGSRDPDQQRTLRVAKLKDGQDGRTWPIRLEAVPAILDARGRSSAAVVVGEVTPDDEAWQRAGLAWTDRRWALPADVEALTGVGSAAARDLARYMRVHAPAAGGTGESRLEAIKALQAAGGHAGLEPFTDHTTHRRGWSRLVEIGRLSSRTADPTGKSMWITQDADPAPPSASPVTP